MTYRHSVIYVGRVGVLTDRRFTEKISSTLHANEEQGWELVNTTPRSSPLGDVSGIWLFFRRPKDVPSDEPSAA